MMTQEYMSVWEIKSKGWKHKIIVKFCHLSVFLFLSFYQSFFLSFMFLFR
jgi:hypothetical protein